MYMTHITISPHPTLLPPTLPPSPPPFLAHSLTPPPLSAVTNFFVCGEVNRVSDIIPTILLKLEPFLSWFRTQTSLRLFATSLLIVYEGAPTNSPAPVDVRLVDFAHTYETAVADGETDNNTLYGLENFTQCLSLISKNRI